MLFKTLALAGLIFAGICSFAPHAQKTTSYKAAGNVMNHEAGKTTTPLPIVAPAASTQLTAQTTLSRPIQAAFPTSCEAYRPLIVQYNWDVTIAMTVMKLESGCNPYAISPTNDHGLFQLNNQPIYDPSQNIAIAYKKYVGGRIGAMNWSAWYSVCTPGLNPQPKLPNIKCQ